ncbi:hypothetical protein BSKO_06287 [Bryopsis sp. KO-2023]|nr:hypothetical protein BSKO_06287 [Bryopsis sp. KO-2023]
MKIRCIIKTKKASCCRLHCIGNARATKPTEGREISPSGMFSRFHRLLLSNARQDGLAPSSLLTPLQNLLLASDGFKATGQGEKSVRFSPFNEQWRGAHEAIQAFINHAKHGISIREERDDFTPYRSYEEKSKWEEVIEKVSSNRRPNPTDMEIAFKNLGFCQHKPRIARTYFNLDWMCGICKEKDLIRGWDPQQMVNVFQACARMGYLNPEMFGVMGRNIMEKKYIQSMNDVNLTVLVYALGLLGRRGQKDQKLDPCGVFFGVSDVIRESVKELTNEGRLATLSEVQMGELWYGLANVKFYDDRYLEPLAEETMGKNRLENFREEALAMIIKSAAVLRYKDRRFRRTVLDEAVREQRIRAYRDHQLVELVHALGLWDMRDEKVLTYLQKEICRPERITEISEYGLAIINTSWGIVKWFDQESLVAMADEITRPKRTMAFTDLGFNYMAKKFGMLRKDRDLRSLKDVLLYCTKQRRLPFFYDV